MWLCYTYFRGKDEAKSHLCPFSCAIWGWNVSYFCCNRRRLSGRIAAKARFFLYLSAMKLLIRGGFSLILLALAALMASFNALSNPEGGNPVGFFLEFNRFQTADAKPYTECYISVDGSTLTLKPEGKGFRATALLVFHLSKFSGKDTIVVAHDSTLLQGELLSDTLAASRQHALMDLRRFQLEPGSYEVSVLAIDANQPRRAKVMAVRAFEVATPVPNRVTFSDVALLYSAKKATNNASPYAKNGLELIPMVSNYTLVDRDTLLFYVEMYHTDALKTGFFAQATLRQGDRVLPDFNFTVGRRPQAFDGFVGRLDIRKLPEGDYELEVALMSFQNEVLGRTQTYFTVKNSRVDENILYANAGEKGAFLSAFSEKDLDMHLKTLRYAATERELGIIPKLTDIVQKRNFIYGFWERRLAAGQTVEYRYQLHQDAISYANRNFKSAMRAGWETERGRVLIKYGTPNNVERYPAESGFVPYEIWRYDRLLAQNNVVFVFADLDVATSEYPLLHSNKYGEAANPLWRQDLRRNTIMGSGNDYEDAGDQNGLDTKLNIMD